eukprot:522008_1
MSVCLIFIYIYESRKRTSRILQCRMDYFCHQLSVNELLHLIPISKYVKRHNDTLQLMKLLFKIDDRYDCEHESGIYAYGNEINLISITLFQILKVNTNSYKHLDNLLTEYDTQHMEQPFKRMRSIVSNQIKQTCTEFISLLISHQSLNQILLTFARNNTEEDFMDTVYWFDAMHYKLLGDCYFYLYSFCDKKPSSLRLMGVHYKKAYDIARNHFDLGLPERALIINNYAQYKLLCCNQLDFIFASIILKTEFYSSLAGIDELNYEEYKLLTVLLSMMKYHLSLCDQYDGARLFVHHWLKETQIYFPEYLTNMVVDYCHSSVCVAWEDIENKEMIMCNIEMDCGMNFQFLYCIREHTFSGLMHFFGLEYTLMITPCFVEEYERKSKMMAQGQRKRRRYS